MNATTQENVENVNSSLSELARVYDVLANDTDFKELDTIERIIVPLLEIMGWPIIGFAKERCVIRGDRTHNVGDGGRRRFDLNLHKNSADKRTAVAIECKPVNAKLNIPNDGVERNQNATAGNKSSLGQLLDQLFDPAFGIEDTCSGVTRDYTIGVWTNGGTWVVVKRGDQGGEWESVPAGLFPTKHVPNEGFPVMMYRVFMVFDGGSLDTNSFAALATEIGFDNVT